jgi:hypothetical protein
MWNKVKAFFVWLYNWLVMVCALVAGALSVGVDVLSSLSGQDLQAFIPAPTAMKFVAGVAMLKTIIEAYRAKKASA